MKYLKVHTDGCHHNCGFTVYDRLDPLTEYSEQELTQIAQDMFNEHFGNWSQDVVDEDEVPEQER